MPPAKRTTFKPLLLPRVTYACENIQQNCNTLLKIKHGKGEVVDGIMKNCYMFPFNGIQKSAKIMTMSHTIFISIAQSV
jgi:hypothetical protein